ncbi:hypothetical protein BOTBODRAFT_181388 [Botryobasidium botryosum FD-172 SS1]|uniref:Uncharacterized protein n=1 Tax=Botryobasidium botryosum (strain FD-172 SS1) TaxID=930990 RepID=A0A067LU80_BOTB1|nr:hypothetical protein BOTBODRAFT_181388 [Botryobasidium botryosum FD-172 SS1]
MEFIPDPHRDENQGYLLIGILVKQTFSVMPQASIEINRQAASRAVIAVGATIHLLSSSQFELHCFPNYGVFLTNHLLGLMPSLSNLLCSSPSMSQLLEDLLDDSAPSRDSEPSGPTSPSSPQEYHLALACFANDLPEDHNALEFSAAVRIGWVTLCPCQLRLLVPLSLPTRQFGFTAHVLSGHAITPLPHSLGSQPTNSLLTAHVEPPLLPRATLCFGALCITDGPLGTYHPVEIAHLSRTSTTTSQASSTPPSLPGYECNFCATIALMAFQPPMLGFHKFLEELDCTSYEDFPHTSAYYDYHQLHNSYSFYSQGSHPELGENFFNIFTRNVDESLAPPPLTRMALLPPYGAFSPPPQPLIH